MRKFSILFSIMVFLLFISGSALAFDFDDLFGDDLIEVEIEEEKEVRHDEALLTQDGWEIGGTYNFSLNAAKLTLEGLEPSKTLVTNLHTSIFFDSRPQQDFRVFGKLDLHLDLDKNNSGEASKTNMTINLQELFSDFNYKERVFFRAGKQNAKWGVGHFYSPANLIGSGQFDLESRELTAASPLALKIHYPKGKNNYYAYLLFDGAEKLGEIALAPRMEYVLGKSELGLGAFYQEGQVPRLMTTISSSLGEWDIFGEAVLSKGSDKRFLEEGQLVKKEDETFFHGTLGASYNYKDCEDRFNLFAMSQIYYDGEGTGLGGIITKPKDRYRMVTLFTWQEILKSKFSASLLWTSNLSDKSGLLATSLSLPKISKIAPSVGVTFNYGRGETEFNPMNKKMTSIFMNISLASGSF